MPSQGGLDCSADPGTEKDPLVLAYLAGAMDADGCFSIKRTSCRKRNKGDCQTTSYIPRMMFGQVQPEACDLLKETFGGCLTIQGPGTKNSKPMFKYHCTDRSAANACRILMPYLRLKANRASLVVRLHEWKTNLLVRKPSYWWEKENPDWVSGPMATEQEVMATLGYSHPTCVSQAIGNGLLLALPPNRNRWAGRMARFPSGLIDFLASLQGRKDGKYRRYTLPPQFIAQCHAFYEEMRLLNKLGVSGTCVNHRTGYYAQTS